MLADMDAQATVPVKDLARARTFYEQVLGLTPVGGDAMRGVQGYRSGASTLVVYESQFAGTNQATAVTWSLGGQFDAVMRELKAKGVTFERYDLPGIRMDGDVHVAAGSRVAWFKDPDGNIINIGNY
ncbi:MAG: glyoxalase [Caulobacteraceae bacterium]|jgi:catechol 2,3-dioxygenase-like lactoylglutathione lyase family enzyme|nr:glyoxalase [Caulobacteraceae bacterium]